MERRSIFKGMNPVYLLILSILTITPFLRGSDEGVLRVGVYDNPPKFLITEDEKVTGFWPELLDYIARNRGWRIEYVHMPFDSCLEALKNGDIDILPDLAPSIQRESIFLFNREPVFYNWALIYKRPGEDIQSFYDLEGKRLAIWNKSIHGIYIKNTLEQLGIHCNYVECSNYMQVFDAVSNGNADAGVVNRIFGQLMESKYGVERTSIVFNLTPVNFAFPKNFRRKEIIKAIDEDLRRLKEDRESLYYKLIDKYFSGAESPRILNAFTAEKLNLYFRILLILLLIIYIMKKWKIMLKIQGYWLLLCGLGFSLIAWITDFVLLLTGNPYTNYFDIVLFTVSAVFVGTWFISTIYREEGRL